MEFFSPNDVGLMAMALALLVTALAGFIKGVVGFAQPLVMIAGMGVFLPAEIVVAGIILPIVVNNLLQVARAGWSDARETLVEFRLYIGIVCTMILISAQFLTRIPGQTMFLVLGIPVVALCFIQLVGWQIIIPQRLRKGFAILAGFIAGALGGLAGTWGPPTVLYLMAVETPKSRHMVAQGVIYGLGSIALLAGHLQSGVLNRDTWPFSALLVIPALIGMRLGFVLQDRLDQRKFRKLTLIVLTVAGLNLVRKGIWG